MAYNSAIPQSTDQLSQSQGQLLANFQAIQTLIGVDHINFNAVNQGMHNVVEFPSPTTFGGTVGAIIALYAKTSSYTSNPVLAFQKQAGGSVVEMTEGALTTNGWSFLPSGLLLKWGQSTGNGDYTLTLPAGATIPAFGTALLAFLQPFASGSAVDPNVTVTLTGLTATTIRVFACPRLSSAGTNVTFNYLILGTL